MTALVRLLIVLLLLAACVAEPDPEAGARSSVGGPDEGDENAVAGDKAGGEAPAVDLVPDESVPAERPPLDLSLPDLDFGDAGDAVPNSRFSDFDPKPLFDSEQKKVKARVTPTFGEREEPDQLPTIDGGKVEVEVKTK